MRAVSSMRAAASSVALSRQLIARYARQRLCSLLNGLAEPRSQFRGDLEAAATRSRRQRQLSAQLRGNDRAQPECPSHGAKQPMRTALRCVSVGRVGRTLRRGILGLAACSLSGPPPAEYVLGNLPAATGRQ